VGGVRSGLDNRRVEAAVADPSARTAPEAASGIAGLQPGRPLSGRFAVVRKDRQLSKAGTPYLALELRDRTGSIPARIFRDADALAARFDRGDAIEARGKVERYRGALSAELTAVRRLEPGAFDPAEFLPSAYRSVEELEGFFEHLVREVHHDGLRAVVEATVSEPRTALELRRAPCTRNGHHAYLGGLLEHTVAVGTLVTEVCQLHPKLNSDLLMAAALLHDIGKTREFTLGAEFGISADGAMLGHLAIGAELIGPHARRLPDELRLGLLHCVLSHHGPEAAGRARGAGSGFSNAEALALARINALEAGVKGALEHGLR
jgi:3'-5' exoribonuclease